MDGELKSLSELTEVVIPQSQIIYARTNSSGQIDLIALSGTGGGSTLYGRVIKAESRADGSDISGGTIYNQFITIDLGGGKTIEREAAIPFRSATLSRRLRERAASHLWSI